MADLRPSVSGRNPTGMAVKTAISFAAIERVPRDVAHIELAADDLAVLPHMPISTPVLTD